MKSTDHNLNNPLQKLDIDLLRTVEAWRMPKVVGTYTQEEYDLMAIHDPTCIYIVRMPNGKMKLYLGDSLIEPPKVYNRYYMGLTDKGEYEIFVDQDADNDGFFTGMKQLTPICIFEDPQAAINALNKYNRIGSHIQVAEDVYKTIKSYIDKEIYTHDFIIGIMLCFGYREDARLQEVIQFAVGHRARDCKKEFYPFFADQLIRMRKDHPNTLYEIYADLYDRVVAFNFFQDKKYQVDETELKLAEEVQEFTKIFMGNVAPLKYPL